MFSESFKEYKIDAIENGVKIPPFEIEKRHTDRLSLPSDIPQKEFLLALCLEGLESKIGRSNPRYKEYYSRMKHELSLINELGFASYVLITWDIINFCNENDIPTGIGRGSAAGSLVLYLINVTKLDSLKYGLYFERFLSKTRAKYKEINGERFYDGSLLFDVDLDISFSHRAKLIEWMENKYKGRISKLLNVTTYTTKKLVKDVLKSYLGYSEEESKIVAKTIPEKFNIALSLEDSIKESSEFKNFCDENQEFLNICRKLYQLNYNFSVHASAMIITKDSMSSLFPTQLTKDKEIVSSYCMNDAMELAIKCDILGLRCCSLIHETCKQVGIKSEDIDVESKIIYDNLQDLKTPHGLFQIEADCNLQVLRRIKPRNLMDLTAIVAIARPGAMQFTDLYSEYVQTGKAQSIHPFFDDVFKDSAGLCLYQESLLRAANKIGFTLDEAEQLRRVIGKKKIEEMSKWEERVYSKCKENKIPEEVGKILWKIMDESKNYSFNLSHSASYASMCAITCYLKFKYPKEFYLSLLKLSKFEANPIEEISKIQSEMKFLGVSLLQPDIVKSDLDFKIEEGNIRTGIGNIKGIADKTLDKFKNFRHQYASKFDIFNSSKEAGLSIGVLSSLIQSGCLDSYSDGITRSKLVLEAQLYNILTEKEKRRVCELSSSFKNELIEIIKFISKPESSNSKPFIKETRLETIRKKFRPYQEIYNQNSKNEKLCNYFYEKQKLGYSYSNSLFDILKDEYSNIISISSFPDEPDDNKVSICGEVNFVRAATSKNKNKYKKYTINDSTGEMSVMLFEKKFDENSLLNKGREIKEGDIVACYGRKNGDIIFCDKIVAQNFKIYDKLSDLKE